MITARCWGDRALVGKDRDAPVSRFLLPALSYISSALPCEFRNHKAGFHTGTQLNPALNVTAARRWGLRFVAWESESGRS